MRLGLERCVDEPPPALARGARFGLLANQASVDARFAYAHDVLAARFPGQLRAVFSPQHGLWGTEQDNMIESGHAALSLVDGRTVPVYSLYSETRRPTAAMLAEIDVLVVDLQDVGTRVYTYAWTLLHCLEECARDGTAAIVLDRPNPLGGELVEGARLDEAFVSFVGGADIPMRHALTMGELAQYLQRRLALDVDLSVVPLASWCCRDSVLQERRWVPPSPNLPRAEGALLYPGGVLIEGTNLSEGRGTTTPFELVGAPYVQPQSFAAQLTRRQLPGVVFRPLRFTPTFQKWQGETCGGVFAHVTSPAEFRPYRTGVAMIATARALWPDSFAWRSPPYEYETERMPIDLLSGSSRLRVLVDSGAPAAELAALAQVDERAWWGDVASSLLYRRASAAL